VAHPVERPIRTVAACVRVTPPPRPTTYGGPEFVHWETADTLFPRCFNHYPARLQLDRPPELSDATVAEWFATYAPNHGAPPGPITWWAPSRRFLFGYRTDQYGQIFAESRAQPAMGWNLDDRPAVNTLSRVIREDGALYMGKWCWREKALSTGGTYFGLGDLLRLADLVGFPRTNRRSNML
jgi:hypothetical protein